MSRAAAAVIRACASRAFAIGVLLISSAGFTRAAAPEGQEPSEEPTDWPATISKLQDQLYHWPDHAPTRRQLATAYNNYGVSLGRQGQWDAAIRQLEEAIRFDDANEQFRHNLANLYCNQAQAAYERHQSREALLAIDKALALSPQLAAAYTLRGQIEYDQQQLKDAKASWQRALELDSSQAHLAERLRQVTQELPVESKFERLSQAYIDLRYAEELPSPVGFDLRDVLLEARREVGSHLLSWPAHKIVVLIYSAASFRALRAETPDWVAGQFDGKIRVPLPGTQLSQQAVRQILFHEYTHALIHDLTSDHCPTWLNEGLAEYEGRSQAPGSLRLLQEATQTKTLIPWEELSDHIAMTRPAQDVELAYQQSYSLTAYLIDRYSFWRMRRILKSVGEGRPWQQVLTDELHLKLSRIEADWRQWLPAFLKTKIHVDADDR